MAGRHHKRGFPASPAAGTLVLLLAAGLYPALSGSAYLGHKRLLDFLDSTAAMNPDIARAYSIGKSYQGRDLRVLEISANLSSEEIPNVKFVSEIHGNAPVGREVLLDLIQYLTSAYKAGDDRVVKILSGLKVHFLPSINPDGFEEAVEGKCLIGPGRQNGRGVDLNRNFPWPFGDPDQGVLELETLALVRWMEEKQFLVSAALHGGATVAIYPYDDLYVDSSSEEKKSETPDEALFRILASRFAKRNPEMTLRHTNGCQSFNGGIIRGADWVPFKGSMMDYNYYYHGCMEITFAISCCKYPPSTSKIWETYKESLLGFLEDALYHVRLTVKDQNGDRIRNARITMMGDKEKIPVPSARSRAWRLLPGKYYFKVVAEGYIAKVVVVDKNPKRLLHGEVWEPHFVEVVLEKPATTMGPTAQSIETTDLESNTPGELESSSIVDFSTPGEPWDSEATDSANSTLQPSTLAVDPMLSRSPDHSLLLILVYHKVIIVILVFLVASLCTFLFLSRRRCIAVKFVVQ